jgi:predicted phosphoribosyltransferase
MFARFLDRRDAGRRLALRLEAYRHQPNVIVLALPRGGVPVGYEVARHLEVPLDVLVVRKLGVPGHEELAFGALAPGGHRHLNTEMVRFLGLGHEQMEAIAAREQVELERREKLYRGNRPHPILRSHVAILVDDGLATGASMFAALEAVRRAEAGRIVVATPVAAASTAVRLRHEADEVVACLTPESFLAVGEWYVDFSQTSDEEVIELLRTPTMAEMRVP